MRRAKGPVYLAGISRNLLAGISRSHPPRRLDSLCRLSDGFHLLSIELLLANTHVNGRMSLYTQETCVRGPADRLRARGSWTKCRVKTLSARCSQPSPQLSRSFLCAQVQPKAEVPRRYREKKQAFPKLNDTAYLVCSIPAASFKHRIAGFVMRGLKATHGSERAISERDLEFFDLTLNDGNTFCI